MARRAAGRFIGWFRPARNAGDPSLQEQLYGAIRKAVLAGEWLAGDRLPSSRTLAADLGLGRNTIVAAIERLVAEGYLETRRGAGLFVAADLPPEGIAEMAGRLPPSCPAVRTASAHYTQKASLFLASFRRAPLPPGRWRWMNSRSTCGGGCPPRRSVARKRPGCWPTDRPRACPNYGRICQVT